MENKPSTTYPDQDKGDRDPFTSNEELSNVGDRLSKAERQQLELDSWDISPEAAHRVVESLKVELTAIEDENDVARIEYEKEQQRIRDGMAENEEEIAAQKTIADRIVKELSSNDLLDPERMNEKVAALDSSFNIMADLEDTNHNLQRGMEASLHEYEQRLHESYGVLDSLRDSYGDYFMAFLQTYDERDSESVHPRVEEVIYHLDAIKASVGNEIRKTLPEALKSLDTIRDKHIRIKENVLQGSQAVVHLISKGIEPQQDGRNIEEVNRQKLVSSLANIDGAMKTSSLRMTGAQIISPTPPAHSDEADIAA